MPPCCGGINPTVWRWRPGSYTRCMTNIADLRTSYERAELGEDASHADPMAQFSQWLNEAIQGKVPEPNAMTLATVGSDMRPSTRVVLVK